MLSMLLCLLTLIIPPHTSKNYTFNQCRLILQDTIFPVGLLCAVSPRVKTTTLQQATQRRAKTLTPINVTLSSSCKRQHSILRGSVWPARKITFSATHSKTNSPAAMIIELCCLECFFFYHVRCNNVGINELPHTVTFQLTKASSLPATFHLRFTTRSSKVV